MNNLKIIFLLILLVSCDRPTTFLEQTPPSSESTITAAAHKFIASQAKSLNTKYNMVTSGCGTSLYDGVKKLTWYFDIPQKLNRDEARIIIMDCVSQIVQNANKDPELKKFFNQDGFTYHNVDIILTVNLGKQEVYYPELKLINFRRGNLGFYTDDPERVIKTFYTREHESYEDALTILKAQGR